MQFVELEESKKWRWRSIVSTVASQASSYRQLNNRQKNRLSTTKKKKKKKKKKIDKALKTIRAKQSINQSIDLIRKTNQSDQLRSDIDQREIECKSDGASGGAGAGGSGKWWERDCVCVGGCVWAFVVYFTNEPEKLFQEILIRILSSVGECQMCVCVCVYAKCNAV